METIKIYTISLGCSKNLVDTEKALGRLGPVYEPVERIEDSRVVFINTCAFIRPAVEESVREILAAAQDIRDLNPRPLLVVTGCLVERYGKLTLDLPEVDAWLSIAEQAGFAETLSQKLGARIDGANSRVLSTPPSFAYLKIAEGCGRKCSFCTIPGIRGPYRSRPAEHVAAEAGQALDQGVSELVLVAQDLIAYGRDLGESDALPRLLDRLCDRPGLKRLRLMYLYPAGLTKKFLTHLRGLGPPLVPYFDIPLQHAHPDMLKSMGRPFAKDPRKVLDLVREHFPEAAVRTTLIVGYPGERPHHFKALARFVEQAGFHHLGVFPYWPEQGTRAERLPGRTGKKVKDRRLAEIMEIQAGISRKILSDYVGADIEILVDRPSGEWPGLYEGRAWFQAPEVDGITYVSGPGTRPGRMVAARVEDAKTYDLVALT